MKHKGLKQDHEGKATEAIVLVCRTKPEEKQTHKETGT